MSAGRGARATAAAMPLAVVAALAIAWEVVAALADDPAVWPSAGRVLGRLWAMWIADPERWTESVAPSMARLGAGWATAVIVGVAVGTLVGRVARLRDAIEPVAAFVRSIPPPALLPLLVVLLGIGDVMKVTLIAVGVVWPILLNTADGVASVDPLHLDTARAYRIGRADRLVRVILPSAAPKIFAGLRVSLSIAIILMVISEMVATVSGIGFELVQAQRGFRIADAWATILLLGLIGAVLNAVLGTVENRTVRWQRRPA